MSFENIIKDGNFHQTATGDYGFRLLTGTAASVTGESFRAIQIISTTAELDATSAVGDSIANTLSLPQGTVIYGKFTAITMSTGTVIAYLAS